MDSLYICYRSKDGETTTIVEKFYSKGEDKTLTKYEVACKVREWADEFFTLAGPVEEE